MEMIAQHNRARPIIFGTYKRPLFSDKKSFLSILPLTPLFINSRFDAKDDLIEKSVQLTWESRSHSPLCTRN